MARLSSLGQRVGGLSGRVGSLATSGTGFVRLVNASSTERGYGADWRRVRQAVLAAEPLCRFCAADGRVTVATEVDHIEPFQGLADPLRLAPSNCRPLCQPCHRQRTARQSHGVG